MIIILLRDNYQEQTKMYLIMPQIKGQDIVPTHMEAEAAMELKSIELK